MTEPVEPFVCTWYARHPLRVAYDLLGSMLVVARDDAKVKARIVEVEAYGGLEDGASHATMYKLGRQTLETEAGVLYMQRSYGLHTMTNIVAHETGGLGAVLLRAAEDPVEGIDAVRARRSPVAASMLVGPGNLSRGVGTRLEDTLAPLCPATGVFVVPGVAPAAIRAGVRIGITRAAEARWRLFDSDSRFVSRHRRGDIIDAGDLDSLIADLPPIS